MSRLRARESYGDSETLYWNSRGFKSRRIDAEQTAATAPTTPAAIADVSGSGLPIDSNTSAQQHRARLHTRFSDLASVLKRRPDMGVSHSTPINLIHGEVAEVVAAAAAQAVVLPQFEPTAAPATVARTATHAESTHNHRAITAIHDAALGHQSARMHPTQHGQSPQATASFSDIVHTANVLDEVDAYPQQRSGQALYRTMALRHQIEADRMEAAQQEKHLSEEIAKLSMSVSRAKQMEQDEMDAIFAAIEQRQLDEKKQAEAVVDKHLIPLTAEESSIVDVC
jgi:hypothetical protein